MNNILCQLRDGFDTYAQISDSSLEYLPELKSKREEKFDSITDEFSYVKENFINALEIVNIKSLEACFATVNKREALELCIELMDYLRHGISEDQIDSGLKLVEILAKEIKPRFNDYREDYEAMIYHWELIEDTPDSCDFKKQLAIKFLDSLRDSKD